MAKRTAPKRVRCRVCNQPSRNAVATGVCALCAKTEGAKQSDNDSKPFVPICNDCVGHFNAGPLTRMIVIDREKCELCCKQNTSSGYPIRGLIVELLRLRVFKTLRVEEEATHISEGAVKAIKKEVERLTQGMDRMYSASRREGVSSDRREASANEEEKNHEEEAGKVEEKSEAGPIKNE